MISLDKVTEANSAVLGNLFQFFCHDLAGVDEPLPMKDGRYVIEHFGLYYTRPGMESFLKRMPGDEPEGREHLTPLGLGSPGTQDGSSRPWFRHIPETLLPHRVDRRDSSSPVRVRGVTSLSSWLPGPSPSSARDVPTSSWAPASGGGVMSTSLPARARR